MQDKLLAAFNKNIVCYDGNHPGEITPLLVNILVMNYTSQMLEWPSELILPSDVKRPFVKNWIEDKKKWYKDIEFDMYEDAYDERVLKTVYTDALLENSEELAFYREKGCFPGSTTRLCMISGPKGELLGAF